MTTQPTATCDTCGWTGGPYRSPKQATYALSRHSCDKHRAKVAHAKAAADRAAERERLIDRTPQPCHHKNANHQHGTYVTYTQDRCRCLPCTTAASVYNAGLAKRNAYGRSNLTDASPARDHVHTLMAAGIGLKQVTRLTGINGGVLCKLMYGVPETGRRPSRRILKANAAKILAIDPTDLRNHAPGSLTDGTGSARRIQALVACGWSLAKIAARVGVTPANFTAIANNHGKVTVARALAVRDLYDELWDTPPPTATTRDRISRTRALRTADARGWVPPLAWDDETIDDPAATPWTDSTPRGAHVPGNGVVNRDSLTDCAGWGMTIPQAADRLHVHTSSIVTALRRLEREGNDDGTLAATFERNAIAQGHDRPTRDGLPPDVQDRGRSRRSHPHHLDAHQRDDSTTHPTQKGHAA